MDISPNMSSFLKTLLCGLSLLGEDLEVSMESGQLFYMAVYFLKSLLFLCVWSTFAKLGGEPGSNVGLYRELRDPHLRSSLSGISPTLWFTVTHFL